jgi:hypothetical protein
MRLLGMVVVHRHGDRTPITPCGCAQVWARTLPSPSRLAALSAAFPVAKGRGRGRRNEAAAAHAHVAAGVSPYGQLTELGLEQLRGVGAQLRRRLGSEAAARLEAEPWRVTCHATPFSRTVQSAQGLLSGLLGAAMEPGAVLVDTSLGQLLLPDPNPRHPRQQQLEAAHWASADARNAEQRHAALKQSAADALVEQGYAFQFVRAVVIVDALVGLDAGIITGWMVQADRGRSTTRPRRRGQLEPPVGDAQVFCGARRGRARLVAQPG